MAIEPGAARDLRKLFPHGPTPGREALRPPVDVLAGSQKVTLVPVTALIRVGSGNFGRCFPETLAGLSA
jgi:hypothetical protein